MLWSWGSNPQFSKFFLFMEMAGFTSIKSFGDNILQLHALRDSKQSITVEIALAQIG